MEGTSHLVSPEFTQLLVDRGSCNLCMYRPRRRLLLNYSRCTASRTPFEPKIARRARDGFGLAGLNP